MQKTTDTAVAGVDGNAQANSRSHSTTPIAPLNEAEEPAVDLEEKAIVTLPTGGSKSILEASSGADFILGENLTPELLARVQQAIAGAIATPPWQKLIGLTQPTVLKGAIAVVLDYRQTHRVTHPVGLLIAAICQQWQPQQTDRSTPVEFDAWFN